MTTNNIYTNVLMNGNGDNFLIKFKGQSAILRNEKYKKTKYS